MSSKHEEESFPIAELGRRLGRKIAYNTVHRWHIEGLSIRGTETRVRLECWRGPSGLETSIAAYRRMIDKLNELDE